MNDEGAERLAPETSTRVARIGFAPRRTGSGTG